MTAGIDFGLRVAAEIAGEEVAKGIQLGIEYDRTRPLFKKRQPARGRAVPCGGHGGAGE